MFDNFWKKYVQYQKPQADVLIALVLPLISGVYNFGWRVLLTAIVAVFAAWGSEFAFTKKEEKPATTASLVTGLILALILPPNVPFWQIIVGCVFAIVFGKMVFGGFGRNVFNPAMVGRCFLYICFPATMAASWYVPFTNFPGGFINYTTTQRVQEADASLEKIDAITSATALTAVKRLNYKAVQAIRQTKQQEFENYLKSFNEISILKLAIGNINGSVGETSAIMIILSCLYLFYRKVIALSLVISPIIGLFLAKLFTTAIGYEVLPLGKAYLIALFGGGTLFAVVFMTTEPISAPSNEKAKWLYGILIGFSGGIIRSMSVFNAGLMFAILLGNMFAPLLDIIMETLEKRGAKA